MNFTLLLCYEQERQFQSLVNKQLLYNLGSEIKYRFIFIITLFLLVDVKGFHKSIPEGRDEILCLL